MLLGIVLIVNTFLLFLAAYFWNKKGVANNLIKFFMWVAFVVNLLVTLNYYGVLLFGKLPLV